MNLRDRIKAALTPDDFALDTQVILGVNECTEDVLMVVREEILIWGHDYDFTTEQLNDLWYRFTGETT